jgi:ABC-type methionine transport system permease subunit
MSTSAAAWALGLGGLGQVLGRLGYRRLVAATTVRLRGVLILALTATALLGLLPEECSPCCRPPRYPSNR